MSIKRPYLPIGTDKEFDKICDRLLIQSPILNEKVREYDQKALKDIGSKSAVLGELREIDKIINGEDGIRDMLVLNREMTDRTNKLNIDMGRQNPKVRRETDKAKTARLRLEARLYVNLKNCEQLNKWLEIINLKVVKVDTRMMLKSGPIGVSNRPHGVIHVDGMPVRMNSEVLVIDCPESPYNGVAMFEYIELIVKPWGRATAAIRNLKITTIRKMSKSGYEKSEIAEVSKKAIAELIKENKWEHLFAVKIGSRPAMPSIPKGVEIHTIKEVKKVEEIKENKSVPVSKQ